MSTRTSTSRKAKNGSGHDFKLSTNVIPSHYAITIEPDLNTSLFGGSVDIDITVHEATDTVQLHSNGLKITRAWVENEHGTQLDAITHDSTVTWFRKGVDASGKPSFEPYEQKFSGAAIINEAATEEDADYQRATFKFAGKIAAGAWKLHVEFDGSMVQPSLEGLYVSDYVDDDGNTKLLASTQFEATHARRSFPCFDEPALKATYDVKLVIDENLTGLSNSRTIKTEKVEGGKKAVTYATTPKQSTYLVAYVVGDIESSEAVWSNGKELRIWTVRGKKHLTEYALKCAAFGVKRLERNFRVKYFGGDKIDFIAIPNFRSGAMENTGLITFRATALLADLKTATIGELKRVAEVVFHELVHQWFGNLVTMAWWDGLPLNESNATIVAYLILDEWMAEWHIFNDFGISRASALALDSLNSTHACWGPVGKPSDVEERFDVITYEKGGSVEYQMAMFIGLDNFYNGMHHYLTRYNHGNAEVTDLWDALEEGARDGGLDVPVRSIMDAWFLNVGHPVVTVSPSDKEGFIKLSQERFRFLTDEPDDQLWPIPLHIRYQDAAGKVHEEKFIFSGKEQEIYVDKGFRHVVVNAGGYGFFRVRYEGALLDALLKDPMGNLAVIERFNLVNDTWALVRAQLVSAETYLGLISKFNKESDPNVWNIISGSLNTLHGLTDGEHRAQFKSLIRDLTKPVFNELGWAPAEGETSATLELRGSLAALLGTIGEDAEVQAKAIELFEGWKTDRSTVDPNVVPALIGTVAYTGDKARFDEFVALAAAAATDQEKLRFLNALGKFRSPELVDAALEMMLTSVKTDDAPYILGGFLATEHGGEATWKYIQDNWKTMQDKFPSTGVVRMIANCSALDSLELQQDVAAFFATNKVKQGDMAVSQMLERQSVNVRLRANEADKVRAFLTRCAKVPAAAGGKDKK